jgi:hypothetical protein
VPVIIVVAERIKQEDPALGQTRQKGGAYIQNNKKVWKAV